MVFLRIEKCKFSIFWNRYDACPIASLRSKINYSKNGFKKDNLIWLMHFCQNNDDCSVYLTWKGTSSFFLALFISGSDTKKCKFILHKWWSLFFFLLSCEFYMSYCQFLLLIEWLRLWERMRNIRMKLPWQSYLNKKIFVQTH